MRQSVTGFITNKIVENYQKRPNQPFLVFTEVECDWHARKIDVIAIKRSNNIEIWGFEVKTSKADFCNDSKWQNYLNYCNKFYFAAPPGLIKKGELPDGVGLVEINANGRFRWVKPTSFRPVEFPRKMIWSIMINRMKSDVCPLHQKAEKLEHYQQALEIMKQGKKLGYDIGNVLQIKYKCSKENEELIDFAKRIKKHIDCYSDDLTADQMFGKFELYLKQIKNPIQQQSKIYNLERLKNNLIRVTKEIEDTLQEKAV